MRALRAAWWLGLGLSIVAHAPAAGQPVADALRQQVWDTEVAFARSMAERDFAAFGRHLSEHAIFWNGPNAQRGKAAVLAAWAGFYQGEKAPFSWQPDAVEVLGDGTLAHSTGPVRDPSGKLIARFHSVWRQEAPGVWRIVLDRGEAARE